MLLDPKMPKSLATNQCRRGERELRCFSHADSAARFSERRLSAQCNRDPPAPTARAHLKKRPYDGLLELFAVLKPPYTTSVRRRATRS
eukprot:scaffold45381_cov71-Phaeocystis_antarctica.AAC.3